MSEVHLTLSGSQRDLLESILSARLKQKQVEVHRTEFSREYRQQLEGEVTQIEGLLDKLAHLVELA
jgi:hypothetical protein